MAEVQAQPATAATHDVDPVRSVLSGSSGSQSSDSPSGADASASEVRPAHEEFWNLPNSITMFRIGVVPILLFLPLTLSEPASAAIAWFFIVAAVTDILDGWLARRGQQVTHIGKLLDPLADKLLVSTALIMLVAVQRIDVWAWWMVVVIIGRELAVTGLRSIASAGGHVMAANWPGKLKTLCQNIAIGALLFHYPTFGLPAHEIGMGMLFIATVLTLWSGYKYFEGYFGVRGIRASRVAAQAADGKAPQ